MVLVATSGNLVGGMKTTQSSQQLTLGSLYADRNSLTWISMYSNSSPYSELIKYDSVNENYTVYQQSGYSYFLQYINPNNNDSCLGLGLFLYVSNTTQACISNISGLTLTTTTSGLEDASSFAIASTTLTTYTILAIVTSENTSITSIASDMDYLDALVVDTQTNSTNQTTSNNQNNGDDDGLSTEKIIGITLGIYIGFALILVVLFIIIYIYCKTSNKYAGRQEVKTEI